MTSKRKLGPIVCKPGSKEAKRIEDTHGFNAALETRKAREKKAAGTDDDSKASSKKGDSK